MEKRSQRFAKSETSGRASDEPSADRIPSLEAWVTNSPNERERCFQRSSEYRDILDAYEHLPQFAKTPVTFAAVTKLGLQHTLCETLEKAEKHHHVLKTKADRKHIVAEILTRLPGFHHLKDRWLSMDASGLSDSLKNYNPPSFRFPIEIATILRQWENAHMTDADAQRALRDLSENMAESIAISGNVADITDKLVREVHHKIGLTIARDAITYCRWHEVLAPFARHRVINDIRVETLDTPIYSMANDKKSDGLIP